MPQHKTDRLLSRAERKIKELEEIAAHLPPA
jgi:hypothetical protein